MNTELPVHISSHCAARCWFLHFPPAQCIPRSPTRCFPATPAQGQLLVPLCSLPPRPVLMLFCEAETVFPALHPSVFSSWLTSWEISLIPLSLVNFLWYVFSKTMVLSFKVLLLSLWLFLFVAYLIAVLFFCWTVILFQGAGTISQSFILTNLLLCTSTHHSAWYFVGVYYLSNE